MRIFLSLLGFAAFSASAMAADKAPAPLTPNAIVAAATAGDWVRIAPDDLLVMDLAPDAAGHARRVVIQVMPPPFSQGWVQNIRTLVKAHWFDGIAVVRVQDNYVVQWGDPDGEMPGKAKTLPAGLLTVPQSEYVSPLTAGDATAGPVAFTNDAYAPLATFEGGWPIGRSQSAKWPLHCYGMVGVGRNLSPDTGTGAELYTVIGHAPRQLDRNIALVGRVIAGMENLSSLQRGTGDLGFYKTAPERTRITSVRIGGGVKDLPAYEYLSTNSRAFAAYAHARANRKDDFYIQPAGGVEVCNVPVPIREVLVAGKR